MHRVVMTLCTVLSIIGCVASPLEETVNQIQPEETAIGQGISIADDSTVLYIANQEPNVASFIAENSDYQYEVSVLGLDEIGELADKYPVIYANLPKKVLYQVDYKNSRGLLVIVDVEGEKVLKHFRTAGVKLG